MNITEKKLAAKLLDMAAEEFGNHGCNDFDLVRDGELTVEQAKEVQEALVRDGISDELYCGLVSFDWMLMCWLAKKLLAEASEYE